MQAMVEVFIDSLGDTAELLNAHFRRQGYFVS